MKHLCIVITVTWLSASVANAYAGPMAYERQLRNDDWMDCESGFVRLGDQCYLFSKTMKTWPAALRSCKNVEADLAHPMSARENAAITTYLRNNLKGVPMWWIGGTDQYGEGRWVWANDKSPMSYTNWIIGEPNENEKNEDCAHYWRDYGYQWNDVACTCEYQFICQQRDSSEDL